MTSTTTTAQPEGVEAVITVPWHLLHDSPLQYRQTYSEATIEEIAATIRDTGRIHQPLVVRRHFPNPLFADKYDEQDGYEIVFGHTRKRAGMRTHLQGAPCIVRDLTDAQVRAAQAAENIARADVHPLEEAAGFRAMIDADGITADELAATLGKSRSYVYGRLRLLALSPKVRQAVLAGAIQTEVGLLIARVGGPKLQEKALAAIAAAHVDPEDGGRKSFRRIRDLLNEKFTLDLASAIFDTEDEMLVPSAGHCVRCPKRSGNAPEFADVVSDDGLRHYSRQKRGTDVCTDPDCFDAKRKAHLACEAARLQAEGKTVITGAKARAALSAHGELKGDFIELAKVRKALKGVSKAGQAGLVVYTVQDQRTGKTVEAVRRADLHQAGTKHVPAPEPSRSSYGSPAEQARRAREREQEEAKLQAMNAQRRQLLLQVREAMASTPRGEFDLRLVASVLLGQVDRHSQQVLTDLWGRTFDELQAGLAAMCAADLTTLVMDSCIVRGVLVPYLSWANDEPEELLAAAAHYGISTEGMAAPSNAGASADAGAAGAGDDDDEDEDEDEPAAGSAGGDLDDAGSAGQQALAAEGTAA